MLKISSITLEEWQAIPGFESYLASTFGRIMTLKMSGHLLKPGINGNGYRSVVLHHNGNKLSSPVGRLVLFAFGGQPDPSKNVMNHLNGIKDDDRRLNLEWTTHRENSLHRYRVLEKKAPQRFAKEEEESMRTLSRFCGMKNKDIAAHFGTSLQLVGHVLNAHKS